MVKGFEETLQRRINLRANSTGEKEVAQHSKLSGKRTKPIRMRGEYH